MHEGRSQNQRGGATRQREDTWAGSQAEGLSQGWSLKGLRLEHSLGREWKGGAASKLRPWLVICKVPAGDKSG